MPLGESGAALGQGAPRSTGQVGSQAAAQAASQISHPAGKYSISGVVVSATTGHPLDRSEVIITAAVDGRPAGETKTGEDGKFSFTGLAAAKYALTGSRRGYITSSYDEHWEFSTAIVTGEGLVSDGLTLRLPPQAVLYGTVTDDNGEPVAQATVSIYRQNARSGLGNIVSAGQFMTDDQGDYEVTRLGPGNYYMSVSGRPWYSTRLQPQRDARGNSIGTAASSSLDVAFPRTFYSNVTDSDSATPIPLKAGDRIPVNFSLHALPSLHMTIQLPRPTQVQGPGGSMAMPQVEQELFGAREPVQVNFNFQSSPTSPNAVSSVEIDGITPGDYQVEMRAQDGSATHFGVVNASGDLSLDAAQATPLADVTGKVGMANGEKLPEVTFVALRTGDQPNGGARVEKDGSFTLRGIAPGSYELMAFSETTALSVTRVAAMGAAVEGHVLKVGSQNINLAATLVTGAATVSGVAHRAGKPASGVMILLAPKDPEDYQDLIRRDQSDSDGTFSLPRVVSGEYTLVAIEDGWTLDWARRGVIEKYLRLGQKVTVPGNIKEMKLPVAIEVQAK
ncbi:MAG TPA: carboxypeptidase regulatory-like domain-containing protein [Acidisarcina sp.]